MDMTQENGDPRGWDRFEILIIAMNERFWLWKGEAYLTPLLSGSDDFPKPVGLVLIPSPFDLRKVVPAEVDLGDLWMINPLVMARLRERDVLEDLNP